MTADGLHRLPALAREAAGLPWFASLGAPITDAEADDARAHVKGLGLPELPVVGVAGWTEARAAASTPFGAHDWWNAEERLRRGLLDAAAARHGRDPLLAALTEATQVGAAPVMGAAAVTAARMGVANQEMIHAAAGAAMQAVYLAALAQAAGHGEAHPFAAKLRLFAAGRWPLGVVNERIVLF
jgi:hypothetical protein